MKSLFQAVGYAISLPERTVRSLAGAVGGVSKLMTDTILPRSLRRTTFYDCILGNTQRFLIESLGEVRAGSGSNAELPPDYLARKIVGNVIDGAGIFAFQFSPLWFFAIVGDVAGGTKEYLRKVVDELKKDGVIPKEDTRIDTAEELLDALSKAGSKTAIPFDAPPLSRADLKKLKDELVAGYAHLFEKGKKALPSVDSLWATVEDVRKRDPVDFLKLMGGLSLASAKAAGKATGDMMYEKVLLSYRDSLTEVRKEGVGPFLAREAKPYLEAIAGAFEVSKKSWTEKLFSGDLFRKRPAVAKNPESRTQNPE